jgi:tRNA (guanine9-N1)-methyltransferase
VYVIGGIVDHNRLKKITYNYSVENKLKMQRFPLLGDTIAIKSNAHLAVNHVY